MTEFFNRLLENLRQGPLGPVVRWLEAHPRISAWIVLALGMNIIFVIAGRDVGLLPSQWAWLITAMTLVAGLCIWIISWEDEPTDDEAAAQQAAQSPAPSTPEAASPEAEPTPKKRTRKPKTTTK